MILTVLVLVPTSVLFARVWQDNADRRNQALLEQKGVQYLSALTPLVSSLAEFQSSALQGVAETPDSLAGAVSRVSTVDAEIGSDLETTQRWAGLKDKISKLAKATGGTVAVFQAHVEVSNLTLALYGTVRRTSQLNRDPDNDLSNLQEATAADMPLAVARVSRMGDLANIVQGATGTTRASLTAQFNREVLAVQDAVNSLTDNLQAAVDDTSSPTLSGSLVSTLDSFRRGVESMTRGANPGGAPNIATISTAQSSLQTALTSLSGVTLREMDQLLDDRIDSTDYRRIEAILMGVLAVLLVLGALIWPALSRRRQQPEPVEPPRPVGESTRDIALNRPQAPAPTGFGPNPYDQSQNYGEVDPTRRERSGAVR
ncbi:MAG: hypothetical protein ABW046_14100 [Actinoplanes sp.]